MYNLCIDKQRHRDEKIHFIRTDPAKQQNVRPSVCSFLLFNVLLITCVYNFINKSWITDWIQMKLVKWFQRRIDEQKWIGMWTYTLDFRNVQSELASISIL